MKIQSLRVLAISWALITLMPFTGNAADAKGANTLDAQAIDKAAGTKATVTADGVVRIG